VIERVVFDTSTLIGAALKVGSKPHRAFMLALDHCVLCGSQQLNQELAEVLNRDYFARRLSEANRESFFAIVRENLKMHEVSETSVRSIKPPCRDAKDNFILALALMAQADAIVSSDQDLLALHPWNGIRILTVEQFVQHFPD